ncbi:hypothetical protein ES703_02768 [subsurface metagenome]
MPAACSHNMTLDRHAEQGQVADEIEDFVSHCLILKAEFLSLQDTVIARCYFTFDIENLLQMFDFTRRNRPVHENQRILQTAPLGQILILQLFYLTEQAEGPGRGYAFYEIFFHAVDGHGLGAVPREMVIVHHKGNAESLGWEHMHVDVLAGIRVGDGLVNDQHLALGTLLRKAGLQQNLHKGFSAAIHHRRFFSTELDQEVINPQTADGRQDMFYRMNLMAILCNGGSPGDIHHMVNIGQDRWKVLQVGTNETDARIDVCRLESSGAIQPGM